MRIKEPRGIEFVDVLKAYKKYVEPFLAILVVVGLIYSGFMLYENYQAKKDIALECGWVEEDVRCTCERSEVIAWENSLKGITPEVIYDVGMDK